MRNLRLLLSFAIAAGPMPAPAFAEVAPRGPALGGAAAPGVPLRRILRAAAPAGARPNFGGLTGAATRRLPDPGPIRRMWFVYADQREIDVARDAIAKVRAANPGVQIEFHQAESVVPMRKDGDGEKTVDQRALFQNLAESQVEFVLAGNQEVYEQFRSLRDVELARDIPFGFAGRKFVSVDIPRASLDPAVLSDPRTYPHRKFLELTQRTAAGLLGSVAGLQGERAALDSVLQAGGKGGHGAPNKKDEGEDMGLLARFGTKATFRLAGQADDRATAVARQRAHGLAAYIEGEGVDVLAIDDPESARVVALMKAMGYHKSLPVLWEGRGDPGDASGLNMALRREAWMDRAPHVALARPRAKGRNPSVKDAVRQAVRRVRLPDNFMEMGGVGIADPEPVVARAVKTAAPSAAKAGARASRRFDVHFLLTNGNGVWVKGDANAFGHFGMAVTDEKGKIQVWTVQYNDGGSFTGGLGDGKQMTLAEYLYASLWYLPGAAGQAIPLAETAVAPVVDFILKGAVDEAGLEAMRRVAADINARHLKGEDNYSFLNKDGNTNCISLVTQILRAAGFHIAESGIQAPADKAVEMIAGLARLNEQLIREGGFKDWRPGPDAPPDRPDPAREARLQAMRRRHHDLDLRLALSIVDEQIARHTMAYQKLRIADPMGRHAKPLGQVREAHRQVLEYRDRMETQDRILEAAEIEQLNALNAKVHYRLQQIQTDILVEIGPVVPQDMTMVSRQVSLQTIDDLVRVGRSAPGQKGKGEKEKGS